MLIFRGMEKQNTGGDISFVLCWMEGEKQGEKEVFPLPLSSLALSATEADDPKSCSSMQG